MPQSTPERRARWVSDARATEFLKSRGYKLTPEWEWIPPDPKGTPALDEQDAILYMVEEWDYGGIVYPEDYGMPEGACGTFLPLPEEPCWCMTRGPKMPGWRVHLATGCYPTIEEWKRAKFAEKGDEGLEEAAMRLAEAVDRALYGCAPSIMVAPNTMAFSEQFVKALSAYRAIRQRKGGGKK